MHVVLIRGVESSLRRGSLRLWYQSRRFRPVGSKDLTCARHFRAKVHYLRETIKLGDVNIEKIGTDDNLADPFTKALAFPKHFELTRNIGLLPASSFIPKAFDRHIAGQKHAALVNKQAEAQSSGMKVAKLAEKEKKKKDVCLCVY
nr:hypothetical protein [Tanacetum cinerariifolium]